MQGLMVTVLPLVVIKGRKRPTPTVTERELRGMVEQKKKATETKTNSFGTESVGLFLSIY